MPMLTLLPTDAMLALSKEAVGYETYGYWPWHNSESAIKDCDEHVSLRIELLFNTC